MGFRSSSGFSAVELMVTVAVVAVLSAIAFPSFQTTLQSNRVATATNELVASLSLARTEAIRSNRYASLCPSAAGNACGGALSDGWLVWSDTNGDGILDGNETVLRFSRGNANIQANLIGGIITFDARGRRMSAPNQSIDLEPVNCGGQMFRRTLTVTQIGQVKVERTNCT
jgi:type IV fimbrial biogenesis protein FimT